MNKMWSKKEVEFLKNYYEKSEKNFLLNHLKRSWSSIVNKAFLLNLNRKNCDIEKLMDESLDSYYWLGFIMADGHFSKTNQIQINLNIEDLDHLKKFSHFINYNKELKKPNIRVCFTPIKEWLVNKLNIKNNKTYYPCSLDNMNGDKLFSFVIGFIDGDGFINKKGYISIKCHSSWLNNLDVMVKFITGKPQSNVKINSENLALVTITQYDIIKNIKNKIIELNLPVLKRKWDRVNDKNMSKQLKREKLDEICFENFNNNMMPKELVKLVDISSSFIYYSYKRWETIKKRDIERELKKTV